MEREKMDAGRWKAVSVCAACLRGIAATKRYARYLHAITALVEKLERAVTADDEHAAQDAYIDLQNLCNHSDALDAEIHRAILDCLNRATTALWPIT